MKPTKYFVLFCLLLLPLGALAEEAGRTYIIQKGDTLWGISQKFLKDPYYWPNLWANNPDIRNPHFIYPGQTVRIYDGRLEIVPATSQEVVAALSAEEVPPLAAAEVAAEPPPLPEPTPEILPEEVMIKTVGGAGFVSAEAAEGVGRVVDSVDNRLLFGTGDTVFLKIKGQAAAGQRYTMFDVSPEEILHPVTGKKVGFRIIELGVVEVTALNPGSNVVTGVIRSTFREVQRGARLTPYAEPVRRIPLKKALQTVSGYLVDAYSSKIVQGQHDVIFIDRGAKDGLQVGNLLYISRPRQVTERVGKVERKEKLILPEELLGSAVVVEARPNTATALVLKAVAPMLRGDRVTAATE